MANQRLGHRLAALESVDPDSVLADVIRNQFNRFRSSKGMIVSNGEQQPVSFSMGSGSSEKSEKFVTGEGGNNQRKSLSVRL